MPEATCAETVVDRERETQPDQASIDAFKERIAASTEHALHSSGSTTVMSFLGLVGRVAREHWNEAKSEYNDLKTQV